MKAVYKVNVYWDDWYYVMQTSLIGECPVGQEELFLACLEKEALKTAPEIEKSVCCMARQALKLEDSSNFNNYTRKVNDSWLIEINEAIICGELYPNGVECEYTFNF